MIPRVIETRKFNLDEKPEANAYIHYLIKSHNCFKPVTGQEWAKDETYLIRYVHTTTTEAVIVVTLYEISVTFDFDGSIPWIGCHKAPKRAHNCE